MSNLPLTGQTQQTEREPAIYTSDGQRIFGVLHRPSAGAVQARPGVAIFHGLVGSKDQPHRIFVTLAEALAREGMVALRIDFPGRGDSEGEGIDMTVGGDLAAAHCAVDYLQAQADVDPERLALVGMSWGGAIAATLAGRDPRISSLALWSSAPTELNWQPEYQIFDGREAAELWGNLVGRQFYEGLQEIQPLSDIRRASGPVLIAYGTEDEVVPASDIERACRVLEEAGIAYELAPIEGADHAFMRHTWEKELIARTVSFLRRTLLG